MPETERVLLFERWAASYEDCVARRGFPFGAHAAVLERMLEALELRPGLRTLELGAGTGLLSERLAAAGAEPILVDGSAAMLERARSRVPDVARHRLDLAQPGWSRGLPQVERIAAAFVCHEFCLTDQLRIIAEASERLVGPGPIVLGDVGFAEHAAHAAARARWAEAWDASEHYWIATELLRACRCAGWDACYEQIGEHNGILILRARGRGDR